jgi:hypothetical protein
LRGSLVERFCPLAIALCSNTALLDGRAGIRPRPSVEIFFRSLQ